MQLAVIDDGGGSGGDAMTDIRKAAEEAWVHYRDEEMKHWPRRQIRKREFVAGWIKSAE